MNYTNCLSKELGRLTSEPTGFPNRSDTTISWNDSTPDRTFTITGTNFKVYIAGVEYTKSTETKQIANSAGLHWIYYDSSGTLSESTVFPGYYVPIIASVYWNGTNGRISEERHGIWMDGDTHRWMHETVGTRWDSLHGGLSATFTNTTFSLVGGDIFDEDLEITILNQTQCRVFYRASGNFSWTAKQNAYYYSSGGNIYWDNAGAIQAATASNYVAYWVFATPDPETPIWVLMGQREDSNINTARSSNTYESLSLGTLPFAEMKLLYRVLVRNTATPYVEAQDMRNISNVPAGTYVATAHNTLTGLTTGDDHTQYVILGGRGASQTLYGGENDVLGSGGYLSLQSTAYSTKGYINIEGVLHAVRIVQTTDETVTDIHTVSVAEGELWNCEVTILGQKSDNSQRASYHLEGIFYRNSGGNITQEGSTETLFARESDPDWDSNLVADTANQTIDIRVTGKAATTINWKVVAKYFKRG